MEKRRFLEDDILVAVAADRFDLQLDESDRATVLSRLSVWQGAHAEMEAVDVSGVEPAFLLNDKP